jgi:hypothetical protein
MTDMREMTDVRELDPDEMAAVAGGDDYCGTVVPGFPIPIPGPNSPVSAVTVVNPIVAVGVIGLGF